MSHVATLLVLSFLDVPLAMLLPLALAPLIVVWHALRMVDKARHANAETDL